MTGIRHHWTFDDMFSSYATQGLESKVKGKFSREELQPLAEVNVTSLKEFDFFTEGKLNGKKVEFEPPIDYFLELKDDLLTLHFTLPLKKAAATKDIDLEIYDPLYFVAFEFAEKEPITLTGAPASCKISTVKLGDDDAGEVPERIDLLPGPIRTIRSAHNSPTRSASNADWPAAVETSLARYRRCGCDCADGGAPQRSCFRARKSVRRAAHRRAAARRDRRLAARQAIRILSRSVGRDPCGQAGWQRGLDIVRVVVRLWRLSCGRSRSRQGGDFVLRRCQWRDLAARRCAVVCLRDSAGAGRSRDRGRRRGAARRHPPHHGRHDLVDRGVQLWADCGAGRAAALGQGAGVYQHMAEISRDQEPAHSHAHAHAHAHGDATSRARAC